MKTYIKNKIKSTNIYKDWKRRGETQREILYGLIFNSTIRDSKWLKYKSFSPGGWAADYRLLYSLYRILDGLKPKRILEFGLGQSSKMIHQYANYYNAEATTCEHDENWIGFFKEGKDGDYEVNIKNVELESISYNGFETLTYKNLHKEFGDDKFDLIVVDGPFGSDHYSRPQIIDLAKHNLNKSFVIVIDDTERDGEKDTIEEVIKSLGEMGIDNCHCTCSASKCHTIICSEDLKFLMTM